MAKIPLLKTFEAALLQFFTFALAASLAFISSGIVRYILHPSNPYNISNFYIPDGFSPEQNFLRVLWIIGVTVLLYFLIRRVIQQYPRLFRLGIAGLVTFIMLGSSMMPYYFSLQSNIDTFHHGEQLSPANAFNDGKGLFTDMYVLHGAGDDVLLPSLALRLAPDGNGIGAYYFAMTIMQLVAVVLFVLLLALVFKNTTLFLSITAWFTFGVYSNFFVARDIFTWVTLALVVYVLLSSAGRYRKPALVAIGSLSSLALLLAVDRGIITLGLAVLTAAATLFIRQNKQGKLFPAWPRQWTDARNAGLIAAGGLAVQLIGIIVIGFSQYKDFLQTYIIDIPKYQGLLFNYPLPGMDTGNFRVWLPLAICTLAIMMLTPIIKTEYTKRNFDRRTILAIVMLLAGILFLRAGYGRSDWGHIAYATPLMFIAAFYITHLFVTVFRPKAEAFWMPVTLVALLFVPLTTLDLSRFTAYMNIPTKSIRQFFNLPKTPDSHWIPDKIAQPANYIKQHTRPDDAIFVFTQQPIYYYLTDRQNPTRFYIPWFADPQPLEDEMLAALQKQKPTLIIYTAGNGWDAIDGVPMSQRAPKVDAWIKRHYPKTIKVGDVTLRAANDTAR